MYSGCNKTAIASQNSIADALIRLMEEKPYSEISVSALCREAGVSRQTFYSIFSDKEQVIRYELTRRERFNPDEHCCCEKDKLTLQSLCDAYSSYIIEKEPFIELLVENRMDSCIEISMTETFSSCRAMSGACTGKTRAYASGFLAAGLVSIARNYVHEDPRPDEHELAEIIYELFSGEAFLNS